MDDAFVSLATFVRVATTVAVPRSVPPAAAAESASPERSVTRVIDEGAFAHGATVRELTLMRLAAFEAFERAKSALLQSLASDVFGRELSLAPVDIERLVARLLDEAREVEPVLLVLAPCDAQRIRTQLPVRVDATLEAGDLVVEVRDGTLESPVRFRLETALGRALERGA